MKTRIKPIVITLSLLGITSLPTFALADDASTNATEVQALSQRTADLERQIQALQMELRSMQPGPKQRTKVIYINKESGLGQRVPPAVVSGVTPPPVVPHPNAQNVTFPESGLGHRVPPSVVHGAAPPPVLPHPNVGSGEEQPLEVVSRRGQEHRHPGQITHTPSGEPITQPPTDENGNTPPAVIPVPSTSVPGVCSSCQQPEPTCPTCVPGTQTGGPLAPPSLHPLLQKPVGGSPVDLAPLGLLDNAPFTLGGFPVLTSPYLGTRSAFDASDLISILPNINEGLHLLEERQKIENVFKHYCMPEPDGPIVDLSGTVQPAAIFSKTNGFPSSSQIDVPTAYLQAMGNINKWVTTFISINFDNTPPSGLTPPTLGPIYANSRVFMDQAFVSLGNLNQFPLYSTIGQIYVPFGQYNSNQVSTPLTLNLFRTKARAALLGYDEPWSYYGLDAQIFTFKGYSVTSATQNKINQFGANLDYAINKGKWSSDFGGSYIANISDSAGIQQTGGNPLGFAGFAGPLPIGTSEILEHRVPALDGHINLGYGPFSIIGEYIRATTSYSWVDATFNDHGARPAASDIEGIYTFHVCNLPANIALGYQTTSQSLAFLLSKRRYTGTFNISLWKDTIESFEYRRDQLYGDNDTATGQLVPIYYPSANLGHWTNTFTIQVAAYF